MNNRIVELSPHFVIPPGSQVVLTVTKTMDDQFKKAGSVGVVVRSPSDNSGEYLIHFADGTEVYAGFDELTLRRKEIEQLLRLENPERLNDYIIYKCLVGSKAFGLSNEDSDDDVRGIFLPPADLHWSLYDVPEQIEPESGDDEVYWEVEKFVRLALKANPNILETLWTPHVLVETAISKRLRDLRGAFLSKHIFKTYSGYVLSQFRRMKNKFESSGQFKVKHAMHLIRLLYSGIHALETKEIMVDVSDHREELLEIRSGVWSFEQIRERALSLNKEFESAFDKTTLPEQPDFESVNQFLVDARRYAFEGNSIEQSENPTS